LPRTDHDNRVCPKADPTRPVTIAHVPRHAGVPFPAAHSRTSADLLHHMWGAEIVRGVQRVAREHQAGVVLSEFGPDRNAIRYWIDDTVTRRPARLVTVAQLSGDQRDHLRARDIPFVVLDPFAELPPDVPYVGATNWRGGRSAARHLIELGHHRIAMISGPDHLFCRARLDGYRAALEAANIPIHPDLVTSAGLTQQDGRTAALRLLSLPDPPTAIFASNDLQALGVYQAAHQTGLRIPADLSVIGFDDLPIAAQVHPTLTTIHQPLAEMAATATTLALTQPKHRSPQGLELATTLTLRHSTALPPST
jgi:DNA-binding LacI/PurR family transcriptional regulator